MFVDKFDSLSILQIAIWRYFLTSDVADTKRALGYICFLQIIPRFVRIIPLIKEMRRTDGFFASSPWAGALYYLAWFMLASHVSLSLILVSFFLSDKWTSYWFDR